MKGDLVMSLRRDVVVLVIFGTGLLYFPGGQMQLTINTGNETIFWEGCILQKRDMLTNESDFSDPCNKCATSRNKSLILFRKDFPQTMYNCTEYCSRVTICTHSWYISYPELKAARKDSNSGSSKHEFFNYAQIGEKGLMQLSLANTRYPLCYECQNWKNQRKQLSSGSTVQCALQIIGLDITFNPVLEHQISSRECWACALWMDLSTAVFCLEACKGYPTFCYPSQEKIGGHKKCYQSETIFGCKQKEVPLYSISNLECRNCVAFTKDEQDAKECVNICGVPMYRKFFNGLATNNAIKCFPNRVYRPDLYMYEIPSFLLKFIHLNNPANLYGVENIQNIQQFSGKTASFVKMPFNMSILTRPRLNGFETSHFLDTGNLSKRIAAIKTSTIPNLAQQILDTYLVTSRTRESPTTYTTDILQQLN